MRTLLKLDKILTSEAFKIIPQIWENSWKDGTMKIFLENFLILLQHG
ncbi:hypothetical protein HMPREF1982_03910 [Clostridiales bacterium oral taxon 876 str. F0540]|nr:hypothetical protein HMPREF1982_03910 [Clostridiales bacterium oral taxon 876 str. F0540]